VCVKKNYKEFFGEGEKKKKKKKPAGSKNIRLSVT